jgi:hypothetical protein
MTRQARIAKLEGKRCAGGAGPMVIYLCDAVTGEPGGALVMGGSGLVRHAGETVLDFKHRIAGLIRAV